MARGERSAVPVEDDFWFVFATGAVRISKVSFYIRREQALEAAGLQ
jgi:hypothetical protein